MMATVSLRETACVTAPAEIGRKGLPPPSYSSVKQNNKDRSFRIERLLSENASEGGSCNMTSTSGINKGWVDLQKNCNKNTSPTHSGQDMQYDPNEDPDSPPKPKKTRTAFSREQVAELEKKFQDKKYLSSAERGELAEKLKLSDMQVKTWFQNRRMKYKRQTEEAEMDIRLAKSPFPPISPYPGMSSLYGYMHHYTPDRFSYPAMSSPLPSPARYPNSMLPHMGARDFQPTFSTIPPTPSPGFSPTIPSRAVPPNAMLSPSAANFAAVPPPSSLSQNFLPAPVSESATTQYMPFCGSQTEWQRSLPTPPTP